LPTSEALREGPAQRGQLREASSERGHLLRKRAPLHCEDAQLREGPPTSEAQLREGPPTSEARPPALRRRSDAVPFQGATRHQLCRRRTALVLAQPVRRGLL